MRHLGNSANHELQITLLEMLTSINPSDWQLLFSSDAQNEVIVNTLVGMKQPAILKASAIQTCSYLIAQPGISFGTRQ